MIVRGDAFDVAIEDGVIAAVGPELPGGAADELDARGLVILPGAVDAHVHVNDPGRADWEGFATGTAALACGGTTTAADMPLNAIPPTLDVASFKLKLAALRGVARVDVALWGGITGSARDDLEGLAARGVVGFKAFMSASGVDEFPCVGEDALHAGMARAAALGKLVAVHAEDDALTARLAAQAVAAGRTTMRDFLDSRPVEAETRAIARALAIAEDAGCALHVVHVSSPAGVELVAEARARGQDVTCETCPHYLVLDDAAAIALGVAAKCAPPLRPRALVDGLWERVLGGDIDLVATDHSPAPAALKAGDAFTAWGGIAGAQTLLALVWDEGVVQRGLPVDAVARLCALAPARRLGLVGKGAIAVGGDADLTFVEPGARWTLARDDLRDRHRLSPFVGRELHGRVVRTMLRGATIMRNGAVVGEPRGRFVPAQKPSR